jgi:hypothetical protein
MEEFTLLFMAISSVTLTEQEDSITWRWTRDGKFSVASAYRCQFRGCFTSLPATKIWRCFVEPKVKFVLWLVLHDKILTADNMLKKHSPCNQTCSLCFCMEETTAHLLTHCNFSEAAWNRVVGLFQLPIYEAFSSAQSPFDWVRLITSTGSKKDKRRNLGILAIFWWTIWKERNRRIFGGKEASVPAVASLAADMIRFTSSALINNDP